MKNGWYPKEKLGNRNVPEDAHIIGSVVNMSGEIITTFYKKNEKVYKVQDWIYGKPIELKPKQVRLIKL